MKTFYSLIVSEKTLRSRDRTEIDQAIDVMKIPNRLEVAEPVYVTMSDLFERLGKVVENGKTYPDLIKFFKDNQKEFLKYNAIYIRISDFDWKKQGYNSSTYGASNTYLNRYISTIGRWTNFSRYKRAYRFPYPLNNLSEQALGIWHEFCHGASRIMGLNAWAWTHTFFYGYDRLYSKADEKKLNPKRYVKTPNPVGAWRALPWERLPEVREEVLEINSEAFEKAVELIFKHEGGYVNNPKDPGGETKYGISKRSYPYLDIKNLTKLQAKEIYYKDYWLASSCDKMSYEAGVSVFDMSVNAGVKTSIKLIQKALGVKADGIIGPITLGAINKSDNKLFIRFAWQRQLYYQALGTFSTFGKGWTNRNFETLLNSLK